MYSNSDYERAFIRYQAEAVPNGESIQAFCNRIGMPYNLFEKWYHDTRHRIVPVQVKGMGPEEKKSEKNEPEKKSQPQDLLFQIDIHATSGLHISQKYLSYQGLKALIEKLEVLC